MTATCQTGGASGTWINVGVCQPGPSCTNAPATSTALANTKDTSRQACAGTANGAVSDEGTAVTLGTWGNSVILHTRMPVWTAGAPSTMLFSKGHQTRCSISMRSSDEQVSCSFFQALHRPACERAQSQTPALVETHHWCLCACVLLQACAIACNSGSASTTFGTTVSVTCLGNNTWSSPSGNCERGETMSGSAR